MYAALLGRQTVLLGMEAALLRAAIESAAVRGAAQDLLRRPLLNCRAVQRRLLGSGVLQGVSGQLRSGLQRCCLSRAVRDAAIRKADMATDLADMTGLALLALLVVLRS
jgi:hypothetical protein